ncbi:MAG: GDP-mannose 4,6-dehydratase [Nanoarchaeota archaeon]
METILITGGAGFVGSYLVEELIKRGNKVIIVDILQKKGGLAYVNPRAVFINLDITNPFLYQVLDSYHIDGVYHLAAQTSGEDSYRDPSSDIQVNAYGTWLIANYCKNRKIKRLIYSSTSAVYGSACKEIVDEETLISPDSIYGVSKYSGELFIKQLLRDSETKYTIFRLTNNYGPGENLNFTKKGMVSIFCSFVWRGEPINVRGRLDRFRDFLFVEDTVAALLKAYDCDKTFNNLYVLSTGKKVFVSQLVEQIIQASGKSKDYPVIISEGTPGDTNGFHADISKVKRDLDWEPRYTLEQGLKKYFEWINKVPLVEDISKYHPFLVK